MSDTADTHRPVTRRSFALGAPATKEWLPLAAREVYLEKVETAATTEALDALLREARQRYLYHSLADLLAAVDRRRRDVER